MAYERAAAESNYYTQSDVIMRPHDPHPDCPDTLACLPDTMGRPQHTLPVILRCAILGSPKKRLTIREIYAAMEKKYPYYKTAGPAWKVRLSALQLSFVFAGANRTCLAHRCPWQQSVRHHLSLNRLFERQQRPATDPGFGSYWTVNLEAPPGTKRPRKRGRTQKDPQPQIPQILTQPAPILERQVERPPYIPQVLSIRLDAPPRLPPSVPPSALAVTIPAPAPISPPAPVSVPAPSSIPSTAPPPVRSAETNGNQIATLRPVDAHSFKTSALRSHSYEDEDDDDMDWGPDGPQVMSDDDFSDDEPSNPAPLYQFRPPVSASSASTTSSYHSPSAAHPSHHTAQHSRSGLHGVFSSPSYMQHLHSHPHSNHVSSHTPAPPPPPVQDPAVEALKRELEDSKRQCKDQENLTRRLHNQLTRAETEMARAKQALKMAESRLEDETRRRVEAERAADDEARLRRQAEDSYRHMQLQMRAAAVQSPR